LKNGAFRGIYNRMKKSDLFFNVLRLPVDFVMLSAAGIATYLLRTEILSTFRPVLFEFNLPLIKYIYLVLTVSGIFLAVYAISGLYSLKVRRRMADEFFKVVIGSSAAIMVVIIYIFLRQELFDSRFLVLGGWFFAIIFVFLGRFIIRHLQVILVSKYNFGIHRVAVIGQNEAADKFCRDIKSDPSSGYRIIQQINEASMGSIPSVIRKSEIDEVVLINPSNSPRQLRDLVDFCQENRIIFKFVPDPYQVSTAHFDADIINGLPLIEFRKTALDGWGRVIKRAIDILGPSLGLIVLSPIFLICAFAIKWETAGPVFVKLRRVSRHAEFDLYKFRSMIDNAHVLNPYLRSMFNDRVDSGPLWKMRNDPRVTKVGRVLRKYRVDELPQLFNVLKGDMSLVGPRPHQPDEISMYQRHHKKVLAIKAGVTGLGQVSGSSDLSFEREVALDGFYIENWSLLTDFKIIAKTAVKMLFDKSAV